MTPSGMHEGMFQDLSILTHQLWGLMSHCSGFTEVRYGPIHLKISELCPCIACSTIRLWYDRTSFWGGGYQP